MNGAIVAVIALTFDDAWTTIISYLISVASKKDLTTGSNCVIISRGQELPPESHRCPRSPRPVKISANIAKPGIIEQT